MPKQPPAETPDHRLMVTVTTEQYEYLRLAAFERRTTMAHIVRELIDRERERRPDPRR